MNVHIITSSYPATPDDPSGTAGLFVRQFALELAAAGHSVIVQPAARKPCYQADPGIIVVPTAWAGGDRELASLNLLNPLNWWFSLRFLVSGVRNTRRINRDHAIDRVLCMWAVPSGLFGLAGKLGGGVPYDVWALGSDIWKIRKIPLVGPLLLRLVMKGADRVYADGLQLCRDVTDITTVPCRFLASSRMLPAPRETLRFRDGCEARHVLFVGRYHPNKGPDLLLDALALLADETRQLMRVHMFGLGPLEAELRRRIAALNLERIVAFHGPIKDRELADYLASVDYLVIPSRIESIPVVFSDALQSGTPVVAMPVGDLPQLLGEFHCGILAESPTAEGLSRALASAAATGRQVFAAGVARAQARFDIRQAVAEWLPGDPDRTGNPGEQGGG